MAGTAGSKYGVVKDGLPVKCDQQTAPKKKLKSLRNILKKKRRKN